jgi:hypothetical protein
MLFQEVFLSEKEIIFKRYIIDYNFVKCPNRQPGKKDTALSDESNSLPQ